MPTSPQLEQLRRDKMIAKATADLIRMHDGMNSSVEEVRRMVAQYLAEAQRIQRLPKGDKGDRGERGLLGPEGRPGKDGKDGKDGFAPIKGKDYLTKGDEDLLVLRVLARIKTPKDGETPIVDYDKIIEEAVEKLKADKKLDWRDIGGLENELSSYRNQLARKQAGQHGGGTTVSAGTNITLTPLPNGTTRIDATGGSGSGTVTDVSVVSANGLAGTVANSTTTPAITLSTTVTGLVKGNGTALSAASAGTDYVAPGAITSSGLTMATARILGRSTASTGAVEEITIGSGLSLSAGTLTATGGVATDIAVGTTTVSSGTDTRILYNNAGVLGEYVTASAATASAVAQRDSNANIFFNNYLGRGESTVSAAGTTVLTAGSGRYQRLSGSSNQTFQLPDATTLSLGPWFVFNNDSSGNMIITNAGGVTQYTVPPGGIIQGGPTSIASANGTWSFHAFVPSSATWGTGTNGLIFNSALSTTPQILTGASSATAPSFIPQRTAGTTGFGGDGTNLFATIGGTAYLKVASGSISPNANDATALGTTALQFSDLFLAEGGVINWDNGDATLTQTGNVLALAGADLQIANLTASEIVITDASKNLVSASVATYPSLTELTYVKGVTSAIQTQLNGKQATGNYITALTGDVTASGPGSVAATLATVNSNVGSFGSATAAPIFTVNAKGLITAASSATITPAVGSITGLGTGVATALAVNVGSAGAFVTFNGALGTPSSGTVTNLTGTASININGTVGATTPAAGTFTAAVANSFVPNSTTIPSNGMYLPAANRLGWAINSTSELNLDSSFLFPTTNDGLALGASMQSFSDLYLASGALINIANSNWVATHSSGILEVTTGDLRVTTAGTNAASVVTNAGTQTVSGKRNQPRTASSTSNANLDPDLSTANVYFRTTQTTGLTIGAPTGTPVIGETIAIYVDSAGAQTLTINSTYKVFGAAFPATTTAGKTFMLTAQFNGTDWKALWSNAV